MRLAIGIASISPSSGRAARMAEVSRKTVERTGTARVNARCRIQGRHAVPMRPGHPMVRISAGPPVGRPALRIPCRSQPRPKPAGRSDSSSSSCRLRVRDARASKRARWRKPWVLQPARAGRTTPPLRAVVEGAARANIPLVRDTAERTRSPDPEHVRPDKKPSRHSPPHPSVPPPAPEQRSAPLALVTPVQPATRPGTVRHLRTEGIRNGTRHLRSVRTVPRPAAPPHRVPVRSCARHRRVLDRPVDQSLGRIQGGGTSRHARQPVASPMHIRRRGSPEDGVPGRIPTDRRAWSPCARTVIVCGRPIQMISSAPIRYSRRRLRRAGDHGPGGMGPSGARRVPLGCDRL